jgi:CDP-glycerol glycerophosphotransferase (TagB/SpsB family)
MKKRKVILLCLSTINHLEFEESYSILAEINAMGEMNRAYIKDLLEAVVGRKDILVKVKPHYANEQRDVEKYVAGLRPSVKCCVESYRAKIFDLEAEADLIVTLESTVIVEALICKKPVIVMNYGLLDSWSFFKNVRPVMYVRDKKTLCELIPRILEDDQFVKDLYEGFEGDSSFFNKFTDGQNAERVVNHIKANIVESWRENHL